MKNLNSFSDLLMRGISMLLVAIVGRAIKGQIAREYLTIFFLNLNKSASYILVSLLLLI